MVRLVCKKCQHDNLIDAPVRCGNQPFQDWFCKKCDEKLFSVSFKKPVHADTVPITCTHCRQSQKLLFNSSESSRTSVSWKCKCNTVLMDLKVDREKQNKAFSPSIFRSASYTPPHIVRLVEGKPQQTARFSNEKNSSEKFAKFFTKNWRTIGWVAIVALVWIGFSDYSSTSYPKNSAPSVSVPKTHNIYRGTQIAKSEFYKYSKSQRRRIQLFLKNNFGYKSTVDGLWGPQTASAFIRAANRYASGRSLKTATNVKAVFNVAMSKQKSAPSTNRQVQSSNTVQNNLGLTDQQFKTYRFFHGMCPIGGRLEPFAKCVKNAFCQAKWGRNCQPENTQTTCYLHRGLYPFPDRMVCE